MEDMMKALLDVVRAQHTATEGSEERPFDINDIIDMALNITGRPEEPEEQQELSDTIQKLVVDTVNQELDQILSNLTLAQMSGYYSDHYEKQEMYYI